ncbi:MAG: DNA polymerase III subunit gamma/tau [Bacilli bacterium]|nr:DNA polymerase III subunit gamma/tau [Bacilli bacterium]
MEHQTLYRKYRPKNFNDVVGQKITIQILKNAINNNQISHAYLFYGPRGTGKTSIAKILSRTINCKKITDGIQCEVCSNCLSSINPNCVDILEIDAASNNGVDEIRELKNKISFVPSELKYKVYIIDEVHMLSTGAFNALLKTLEEPPKHAVFILATTELQKVPLTIISRCQTFEFRKIDSQSMKRKLEEISAKENIQIDDTGIKEIIRYSNGGLRDAIGILEKASAYTNNLIDSSVIRTISGNISEDDLKNFIQNIENKNIDQVLSLINSYYDEGIDLINLCNSVIDYVRNSMINEKKYNKSYCSFIIRLDNVVSMMEKSQNPKIILEASIIEFIIDNEKKQDNYILKNNNTKTKEEAIIENEEILNSDKNSKSFDFENIKEIRVNNTLYDPKKDIISKIRNNWNKIMDLAFDEEFGNLSRMMSSDTRPVAASNSNMILVSKLIGMANQINKELDKVEKIINKVFDFDCKIICISDEEWKNYTLEYKNNKEKFKYTEEKTINNQVQKKKSLKEKAKELFD